MKSRNCKKDITDFLSQKRFAAVGVSKEPRDFSRSLFGSLVQKGYDVVPVNPSLTEIEGRKCYASIADIETPITAALILTPPAVTEKVVRDCAARGIGLIWMHRGAGVGAVSESAIAFCHEHGIRVIAGECPFMFLPQSGLGHRIHGLIRKATGAYPN